MRVVFLGSPEFAVHSLEALAASRHEIVGVITQPDRPAGRGLKTQAPAVKRAAEARGFAVFQPESINAPETLDWIREKNPDILAVVAFGEFLGKNVLRACRLPPVNVHPSLLPELRGAAPIQWALVRGLAESGVSTQFMVSKMDAGDILLQESVRLGENETAADLHDRLGRLGGELLVRTLTGLEQNTVQPRPQDDARATFAPLLTKADGNIRWQRSAKEIHNQIRGLYPWPGATTTFLGQKVKLLRSRLPQAAASPQAALAVGEFVLFGSAIFVGTGSGMIEILELQPEGKRAMLPQEFANGIRGKRGDEAIPFHFGT